MGSQVVEPLVEEWDVLFDLTEHVRVPREVRGVASFVDTELFVVLGDLVGVLARCRDFDRSSPVEVEMTQLVGQFFQLILTEG